MSERNTKYTLTTVIVITFKTTTVIFTYTTTAMRRDSLVGIATGYGLNDRMIGVRFLAGTGNFSLLHRVQTSSGAHPAFYPMDTWGSFPGVKAAGA
jgi:hypothetical protein